MHQICKKPFLVPLLLIVVSTVSSAQQWSFTQYTIEDGLPSNGIYRCVQDKKGFLWIATENGLSRFDGQQFTNFTTKDGLPDNEIIDVFTDSSDNVWVTPFTRFPAYFDATRYKIINHEINPELARLKTNNVMFGNTMSNGNVVIYNPKGCFVLKEGKLINAYADSTSGCLYIKKSGDGEVLISTRTLSYHRNNVIQKTVALPTARIIFNKIPESNNRLLYATTDSSIVQLTNLDTSLSPVIQKTKFPFLILNVTYLPHYIGIVTGSGIIYLLDKTTFNVKDSIVTSYAVRSLFSDMEENIWICTGDRGLVKANRPIITTLAVLPRAKQENMLAIMVDEKGISAGDVQGNVLHFRFGQSDVTNVFGRGMQNNSVVIKKIIHHKNDEYVFSNAGLFKKDKEHYNRIDSPRKDINWKGYKDAVLFNDSLLLLGTYAIAYICNIRTLKINNLIRKRVTVLATDSTGGMYLGSNDGLYKWEKDALHYYGNDRKVFTYRVASLCTTPDNLVWVGIAADSLIVLKNDVVLASIPLEAVATGTICKSLASDKPGELWLGTDASLSRIEYTFKDGKLQYCSTIFSAADGLCKGQVNSIALYNDTVYAATTTGISLFNRHTRPAVRDIPVYITQIWVNEKAVDRQPNYTLPLRKNSIRLLFSGVDLTGFPPTYQYKINDGSWQNISGKMLLLRELSPGRYHILIRALNRSKEPSRHMAFLLVTIETPLWRNPLVIIPVALFLAGSGFYFLYRRSKLNREKEMAKLQTDKKLAELELQAIKSKINPHFIFNCLNSIKLLNYQNKNEEVDLYLEKFSSLLRNTLDYSTVRKITLQQELDYIENYLSLEKLRMREKLSYTILVSECINKNTTLIPAMLLQPYIENAIKHGLRFLREKKGIITIRFIQENNTLICIIEDNGIGRLQSTAINSSNSCYHQSKGMELASMHAHLESTDITIWDKTGEDNQPSGTMVTLKIQSQQPAYGSN